jgi:hypothetical protein
MEEIRCKNGGELGDELWSALADFTIAISPTVSGTLFAVGATTLAVNPVYGSVDKRCANVHELWNIETLP